MREFLAFREDFVYRSLRICHGRRMAPGTFRPSPACTQF